MNTNTTHTYEMAPADACYYRTLPKTKHYQEFKCRDCGALVMWAESRKTGKTYLAVQIKWEGEYGRKMIYPGHDCNPDTAYQERYAEAMRVLDEKNQANIANGELVVGQAVEVYKGRKVPVGTTGIIFWIAPNPDQYGNIRAGIKTANEETVWVSLAHLRAVTTTGGK